MTELLPFVAPVMSGIGLIGQLKNQREAREQMQAAVKANPVLSWDQAMQQAATVLSPTYDSQIANTMQQSDKDLIARGMFGQLPGAALTQSRRLDALNNKQGAINNLAMNLVNQSQGGNLQAQQMAMQNALNQGNLTGQTWQNLVGMMPGFDWVGMQQSLDKFKGTGESPVASSWLNPNAGLPSGLTSSGWAGGNPQIHTLPY